MTGDCLDCPDNTTGTQCELCVSGYYGSVDTGCKGKRLVINFIVDSWIKCKQLRNTEVVYSLNILQYTEVVYSLDILHWSCLLTRYVTLSIHSFSWISHHVIIFSCQCCYLYCIVECACDGPLYDSICHSVTGVCQCLSGLDIVGNCTSCLPGFYNLSSNGKYV